MKKITIILLSICAVLILASCEARTGPSSEWESSVPETQSSVSETASLAEPEESGEPPEQAVSEPEPEDGAYVKGPYDDMLLIFGGVIEEPDRADPYLRTDIVGLYFTNDWDSPMEMEAGSYFGWYMSMMRKEDLTYEQRKEKYKSPLEEDEGWFFPQDLYEAKALEHFDVTVEYLRSELLIYSPELEGYYLPMGGGIGERPEIILREAETDGDIVKLHISLTLTGSAAAEERHVLTVRTQPDGGFKYLSWKTEE